MPKNLMSGPTDKLSLMVLEMCEKLLPKTTERSNQALINLLKEMRKSLEGK
jgi:hypothetical protein